MLAKFYGNRHEVCNDTAGGYLNCQKRPELLFRQGQGIQKYSAKRLDCLIRDAIHAAADRADNVAVNGGIWASELKDVEVKQINMLLEQCRAASAKAIADMNLTAARWEAIEGYLNSAESALATLDFAAAYEALQNADNLL